MCSSGDIHDCADPEPGLFRKVKQSQALWLTIELIMPLRLLGDTHTWGPETGKIILIIY